MKVLNYFFLIILYYYYDVYFVIYQQYLVWMKKFILFLDIFRFVFWKCDYLCYEFEIDKDGNGYNGVFFIFNCFLYLFFVFFIFLLIYIKIFFDKYCFLY